MTIKVHKWIFKKPVCEITTDDKYLTRGLITQSISSISSVEEESVYYFLDLDSGNGYFAGGNDGDQCNAILTCDSYW